MIQRAAPPPPTHYELPGGKRYPRVTSILSVLNKPGLNTWRAKVGLEEANRISKEATDFGTRLHAAIEQVNRQQPGDAGPDLQPFLDAYLRWFNTEVGAVLGCERLCVSHEHGFAGTADCLAELVSGELALLDFKSDSGRVPHQEHQLQTAAYRLALAEDGLIVRRRLIIQLPRTRPGELVVHEHPNHRRDTEGFLACLALWRWREGNQ